MLHMREGQLLALSTCRPWKGDMLDMGLMDGSRTCSSMWWDMVNEDNQSRKKNECVVVNDNNNERP
jgi:hypothetical protein